MTSTVQKLPAPTRPASAKRRPLGVPVIVSFVWLAALTAAAIFAPILPLPDPATSDYAAIALAPFQSLDHILGTDTIGRDILSRAIFGARVSLLVGVGAVAAATVVGGLLGLAAGYFGRATDRALSIVIDILLAFPGIVAVIALTVFLGPGLSTLILGIGAILMPMVARVTRSATGTFANREFVIAARGMGMHEARILFREVLPNVVVSVVAYSMTLVAVAIATEGGLSFLGLGIPAPESSWGSMMGEGRGALQTSPHIVLVPAAIMCITLLSINFIAEFITKRFDIREAVL
ncbi:ABC transporter permease [Homoserinimonas hongtaonis]|uniref:ABC transporter permease n=1 Tax=Homoserinimonas hongtaonis TaxID=2079791 RepID=A0A2U1T2A7_9MICO|nr:ABC transporter permease [Salinibacterium hongtaonis]PWB98021.1 ABC transporter permease [Salinibacterium hongtaonis]